MSQNPIPAYAYGQNPSRAPKLIQVDADGNVIMSPAQFASIEDLLAAAPQSVATGAAVMTNGLSLFTITGGPIQILGLVSICQTANDATASTLQYQSTSTLGTLTQTISGASASLANAAIGTSVVFQGTALATAPLVNANAANIVANGLLTVPAGALKAVIGVGSTTGTWKHFLRYAPLAPGAVVAAAF